MDGLLPELDPIEQPKARAVRFTPDLKRIRDLPRRDWESLPSLPAMVAEMSRRLRTGVEIPPHLTTREGGPVPEELLPSQTVGIHDAGKGAFVPLTTGAGKTLLTLLAQVWHNKPKAVLLLPKGMVGKTLRTANECAPYWRVPDVVHYLKAGKWRKQVHRSPVQSEIWLVNYEMLPHRTRMLLNLEPDMLMADEAHWLKSTGAARTKVVKQLRQQMPGISMSFLSGSFMGRGVKEFAHLVRWALGPDRAPVPSDWREIDDWSRALSSDTDEWDVLEPGALLELGDAEGQDDRECAQKRFAQRLTATPRVVSSKTSLPSCGLVIRERSVPPHEQMVHWLNHLRAHNELPNGEPCVDPLSKWAKASQVCLGFWYQYVTPPPLYWKAARRAWAGACMEVLTHSQTLLSALDVTKAIDRGEVRGSTLAEAAIALGEWRAVRNDFKPETKAVWWDDAALKEGAAWLAANERGLLWSGHIEFGEKLSETTGIPYFREGASTAKGVHIYDHKGVGPAIVSMFTCHEGLDLEWWNANVLFKVPHGRLFEQLISRTHRAKQKADDVTCEVLLRTEQDFEAWGQTKYDSRGVSASMDARQRLSIATILKDGDEV
jgi:hypothetical protein